MWDKIRPNVIFGMICLVAVVTLAVVFLEAGDAKTIVVAAVTGIAGVFTDLLRADRSEKGG